MQIFNADISVAVIYDIFDIHEFAEFTGGSSFLFYWKLLFSLSFVVYNYFISMIDFQIPHADFKFLFWGFSECPFWWFLIKNIEENIHGYVVVLIIKSGLVLKTL